MHSNADATAIERTPSARKRRVITVVPYCAAIIVLVLLGAMLVVLGTADRVKGADIAKIARPDFPPELTSAPMIIAPKRPVQQPVSVKFQHVIFRVGDWEVFRFTYEEGEDCHE